VATKLAAAMREHELGIPDLPERQTLAEHLRIWLGIARATVVPATTRRYEEDLRLRAIPAIGRHSLACLTPQHLQDLYTRKLD